MALLRSRNGLWLLGDEPMAFPRRICDPVKLSGKGVVRMAFLQADSDPSLGAFPPWHCCVVMTAPNKTGGRGGDGLTSLSVVPDLSLGAGHL